MSTPLPPSTNIVRDAFDDLVFNHGVDQTALFLHLIDEDIFDINDIQGWEPDANGDLREIHNWTFNGNFEDDDFHIFIRHGYPVLRTKFGTWVGWG